ncbi:hypothetical protein ASZ90_011377 [hydrocarbon metagenome]|uniref:Uncharacterized protein n=1 Tax=hydrocarbon metagenome TaxID=938273 RepID=A0A0W8FDC7_9ZZZZ
MDKDRFIPTHVGNSTRLDREVKEVTVHPHACGELTDSGAGSAASIGSSPRMWGTLGAGVYDRLVERFIPTHVGNSTPSVAGKLLDTVHPHACGELQ